MSNANQMSASPVSLNFLCHSWKSPTVPTRWWCKQIILVYVGVSFISRMQHRWALTPRPCSVSSDSFQIICFRSDKMNSVNYFHCGSERRHLVLMKFASLAILFNNKMMKKKNDVWLRGMWLYYPLLCPYGSDRVGKYGNLSGTISHSRGTFT